MTNSQLPSNPLSHQTIWVACSEKLIAELRNGLESMGGTVIHFPVLQIREIEDKQLLDEAILSIKIFDWIIFTSAYGVQYFFKRMNELGAAGNCNFPKICSIGPATAAAISAAGFRATLVAEKYVAEGVLAAMSDYYGGAHKLSNLRVLLPRAQRAREFLPEALSAAGSKVAVVPCYQMVRPEIHPDELANLANKNPDLIVFTSASTIKNMVEVLGTDGFHRILPNAKIAVLGPITANEIESHGKGADIIPETSTVASLLEAIGKYFSCS
jgi:uroporphyrinogen III methyltransferase/synthase